MKFKPSIWFPIAATLSGINVAAIAFAMGEPWHAMAHGALAVAFGLWAQRLKQRRDVERGEQRDAVEAGGGERVDVLEDEMTRLRQELSDAQERLDFTERMLARKDQPRQ